MQSTSNLKKQKQNKNKFVHSDSAAAGIILAPPTQISSSEAPTGRTITKTEKKERSSLSIRKLSPERKALGREEQMCAAQLSEGAGG